jgi:hypothetical protein
MKKRKPFDWAIQVLNDPGGLACVIEDEITEECLAAASVLRACGRIRSSIGSDKEWGDLNRAIARARGVEKKNDAKASEDAESGKKSNQFWSIVEKEKKNGTSTGF